jgi:hypothetical protein
MTNIELKYTSNGMLMHGYINGKLLYPEQVSQVIFDAIKDWSQLPYDLKSPKTIEMYLTNFSDSYLRTLQNILGNREINFTATGDSYQYNLRETKMTKETLRMQMLSGIITESEYKTKLEEIFGLSKKEKEQKSLTKASEDLKKSAKDFIDKLGPNWEKSKNNYFVITIWKKTDPEFKNIEALYPGMKGKLEAYLKNIEDEDRKKYGEPSDEPYESPVSPGLPQTLSRGDAMLHGVNQPNFESMNEQLRMQMLSGIITEGEYKAKLQENSEKSSLNESMIGGIVGVGAIAQIPPRAKADYEMAFEHFLGERYLQNFNNPNQDLKEDDNAKRKDDLVKLIATGERQLADLKQMKDKISASSIAKAEKAIDMLKDALEGTNESKEESLYENNGMNVVANILEMIKNGMGDEEIITYMMDNNFESEEQAREQLLLLKGALDKMKQALNPAPSRIQSQLAAMRDKYRR